MNREIKFRAWDKKEKRMYLWDKLSTEYNLSNWINDNNAGDESLVLMQYTGLKDKNDKEIYEGDIIRCKVRDKHSNSFFPAKYKNKNYVIEWWQSYSNCGYRVRNKGNTFMIKQSILDTMECEVIGNIYENPELLEV